MLVPPFAAADVTAALRTLRIAPLLEGVRGDPPLDIDALAEVVVAVGQLHRGGRRGPSPRSTSTRCWSAPGDEGAVVLDALVEREAEPDGESPLCAKIAPKAWP